MTRLLALIPLSYVFKKFFIDNVEEEEGIS